MLVAILVVALTTSLGIWQLRRADEKQRAQAIRDVARAEPAVRLDTSPPLSIDGLEDRRVELVGRFEADGTLLLDNRTHLGVAGFHVLTPLRLDGNGRVVMVLRGWVARAPSDRTRSEPFLTPTDRVRVIGLAARSLSQPMVLSSKRDELEQTSRVRQHFDFDEWQRNSGVAALPIIVRQTSALDDLLVRAWTEPGAGVDRHLGYAVQWFAMTMATVALWAWYGRRTTRKDAERDA